MHCVSEWYPSLSCFTFPTIFIRLKPFEIESLISTIVPVPPSQLIKNIQRAIVNLPGNCFIHADCCAPTDSPLYQKKNGAVNSGTIGWEILRESAKVINAFANGKTERIAIHPYRRMDKQREFRVFVWEQGLSAMSQLDLNNYFPRIVSRSDFYWQKADEFVQDIAAFLPQKNIVIDLYFTSKDEIIIIDLNDWGLPTDPLLLRIWDRNWEHRSGLKLISKPVKLKGNVSVSF